MLDIIVTHYKEPWETCEKFFMMLDLQRDADFSKIHVIIVNDGLEGELDSGLFKNRPYHVKRICIPHGGVSAARNAGLMAAESRWVMFCDCDDMFSNVYAIRSIQDVMPADGFDMLWSDIIMEDFSGEDERIGDGKGHKNKIYPYGQNNFFIHGKLYRREFLIENNLFFDTTITYSEDTLFNRVLDTYLNYKRVGQICSAMPMYIWTYTKNSVTTADGEHYDWYLQMFHSNKKTCECFRERLSYDRYCNMVYKTVWEVYRALNYEPLPDGLKPLKKEFQAFWRQNKAAFQAIGVDAAKEIEKLQTAKEPKLSHATLLKWLSALEKEAEK